MAQVFLSAQGPRVGMIDDVAVAIENDHEVFRSALGKVPDELFQGLQIQFPHGGEVIGPHHDGQSQGIQPTAEVGNGKHGPFVPLGKIGQGDIHVRGHLEKWSGARRLILRCWKDKDPMESHRGGKRQFFCGARRFFKSQGLFPKGLMGA